MKTLNEIKAIKVLIFTNFNKTKGYTNSAAAVYFYDKNGDKHLIEKRVNCGGNEDVASYWAKQVIFNNFSEIGRQDYLEGFFKKTHVHYYEEIHEQKSEKSFKFI